MHFPKNKLQYYRNILVHYTYICRMDKKIRKEVQLPQSVVDLIQKKADADNRTWKNWVELLLVWVATEKVIQQDDVRQKMVANVVEQPQKLTITPVAEKANPKEQARLDIAAMLERQKSKVKPMVVASFGTKRVE